MFTFDCRLLADLGVGWVALLCSFEVPTSVPKMPIEEIYGSFGFVCHKEYLAQKSDLKMKGEDNSLLLTQGKLFLGNIFQGVGNVLPQGSFSGKCRKFIRS